jgi:hypothetical protein
MRGPAHFKFKLKILVDHHTKISVEFLNSIQSPRILGLPASLSAQRLPQRRERTIVREIVMNVTIIRLSFHAMERKVSRIDV